MSPDPGLAVAGIDDRNVAGQSIIRANVAATAVFAITAALAAVFFTSALQWVAAICALVLFAAGVFCFLWSYLHAVQRSRSDEIGVANLYLLTGPPTPVVVRRTMLAVLAIQVVIAAATTFARPDGPDGRPGSSLALGFLVPMLGFGLNGLWAAFHGRFPSRLGSTAAGRMQESERSGDDSAGSATGQPAIGQNGGHG